MILESFILEYIVLDPSHVHSSQKCAIWESTWDLTLRQENCFMGHLDIFWNPGIFQHVRRLVAFFVLDCMINDYVFRYFLRYLFNLFTIQTVVSLWLYLSILLYVYALIIPAF